MKGDDLHREFRRQVRLTPRWVDPAYRREVAGPVRRLYPIDASLTGAVIESPQGLGESGAQIDAAIARQVSLFQRRRQNVEWVTYGDDQPRDLPARLRRAGFEVGPEHVLMLGPAAGIVDLPALPAGLRLSSPASDDDWARVHAAFDDGSLTGMRWTLDALRTEHSLVPRELHLVVAEQSATGRLAAVGAVRLFPGSQFAQIVGVFTLPQDRGRGISSALMAWQANVAEAAGHPYLRMDVPPELQSVLAARGMHPVTTSATGRMFLRPRRGLPQPETDRTP